VSRPPAARSGRSAPGQFTVTGSLFDRTLIVTTLSSRGSQVVAFSPRNSRSRDVVTASNWTNDSAVGCQGRRKRVWWVGMWGSSVRLRQRTRSNRHAGGRGAGIKMSVRRTSDVAVIASHTLATTSPQAHRSVYPSRQCIYIVQGTVHKDELQLQISAVGRPGQMLTREVRRKAASERVSAAECSVRQHTHPCSSVLLAGPDRDVFEDGPDRREAAGWEEERAKRTKPSPDGGGNNR
jgi:hypothetical protein